MLKIKVFKIAILVLSFMLIALKCNSQNIEKSIFITANTHGDDAQNILSTIVKKSKENSTLLIVGNAVSKEGFNEQAKVSVMSQLSTLSSFNGTIIFTPGNNEWATNGHRGVRSLEEFIQKNSTAKFYPDEGCPIKKRNLGDHTVLITVDSQWYLENWNNHIYLNEDCDIKNRSQFFLEFESLIKKAQGKTKIIALYHPIFSNTVQGFISKIGGTSIQDFQNKYYKKFRDRLVTIARQSQDIIFVSGQGQNLQYLNRKGITQIISGAAGETKKVKHPSHNDFGANENGYARIDVLENGGVNLSFQNASNTLFSTQIISGIKEATNISYKAQSSYGNSQSASVYSNEETDKSRFYQKLWGKHYREYYGKPVEAPIVFLDTLMGGLTPVRRGGGHQSLSLRLEDKNGKQYVMRALRKSGVKFLQATVFADKYVEDYLEDTFADKFLMDFYTAAHPYTPFAVGTLADAVDVFHSNPKLYYIPKQDALGVYNDKHGGTLYMIEERVESSHKNLASFGNSKDILSTDDVLKEIHKTGKAIVDEPSYIRARLFDMLIGDWDRHEDQWRWALFKKEDGTEICKPIPRDRDQAFSKFDGSFFSFLRFAIPNLKMMQSFDDELKSPDWFNFEPYPLDMTFINQSGWKEWEAQAIFLQDNLSDAVIERAFETLPNEMKTATIDEIKSKLKGRRGNIVTIAREYFEFLNKFEVLTGTQKDDTFEVNRKPNGETTINIHRKDLGILNRTFTKEETKEIWIYGLDGKDTFIVDGDGNNLIKIKIVGGKKNDTYDFKNPKKVKIYDYKGKNNTIVNKKSKKWLVDDYGINNYDYKKRKHTVNQTIPIIGANPDDGLKIGIINNFVFYGLQRNPFTQKHTLSASYYSDTSGYDVSYSGEFSNIFHNWNFGIDAGFTSPNFAMNHFGFGNETKYDDDLVDLDFNRVRIKQWNAGVSLIWRGRDGGYFHFKPLVESFEVDATKDRFVTLNFPKTASFFEKQIYAGAEASFTYKNKDNSAFPKLGLDVELALGYKTNVDNTDNDNSFAYIKQHIAIDHKLSKSGKLVLASKLGGEALLGNDFEFYHAAQLGGTHSLRGFRNERFTGKYSLYQNTDLRFQLGKIKKSFIPLKYGITAGFDYGRVWLNDDNSNKWNNSAGGSLWINGIDAFTANLGYYRSTDGGRVVFMLGFAF